MDSSGPRPKLVFAGDSVTAGRKSFFSKNVHSYCNVIEKKIPRQWDAINRGKAGNRVGDLSDRWQSDVISLQPRLVSVNIGVNDSWKRPRQNFVTPHSEFRARYTNLLLEAKAIQGMDVILCEPFMLPLNDQLECMREDLLEKISIIHELANRFNLIVVPFDDELRKEAKVKGERIIAKDGIHPTSFGAQLMGKIWLSCCSHLLLDE